MRLRQGQVPAAEPSVQSRIAQPCREPAQVNDEVEHEVALPVPLGVWKLREKLRQARNTVSAS
jgi:hypothetical protein